MSTTSLKLPEALKQRVLVSAQRQGISPHAFMLSAIEQAATADEQRAAFIAQARAAEEQMLNSGQGYDGDEVHAYIEARIAGKNPARPKAKAWRG